jgi:hypothetical protein
LIKPEISFPKNWFDKFYLVFYGGGFCFWVELGEIGVLEVDFFIEGDIVGEDDGGGGGGGSGIGNPDKDGGGGGGGGGGSPLNDGGGGRLGSVDPTHPPPCC